MRKDYQSRVARRKTGITSIGDRKIALVLQAVSATRGISAEDIRTLPPSSEAMESSRALAIGLSLALGANLNQVAKAFGCSWGEAFDMTTRCDGQRENDPVFRVEWDRLFSEVSQQPITLKRAAPRLPDKGPAKIAWDRVRMFGGFIMEDATGAVERPWPLRPLPVGGEEDLASDPATVPES